MPLLMEHSAHMRASGLIQYKVGKPRPGLADTQQVCHFALWLRDVQQVFASCVLRLPLPALLHDVPELFRKIRVTFARLRCRHLQPNGKKPRVITIGVTLEKSF